MKSNRSQLLSGDTALVFGCGHCRPDETHSDFDRFYAIGKMALDYRVDAVLCTGDLTDYPGARSWNSPKRQERKRVLKDRQAGIEAAKAVMSAYRQQKRKHQRQGHPERVWEPFWGIAAGNHDDSEDELVEQDPKLEGIVGSEILYEAWRELGWSVHSFKRQLLDLEYPEFKGAFYGHYYPSGPMGRATAISSVLNKAHGSLIFSHTHKLGFDMQRTIGGRFIQAVNIGTLQPPERLKPGEWNGAVLLSEMDRGQFQVHQISYDAILREYGEGDYAQRLRTARAQAVRDRRDAAEAFM